MHGNELDIFFEIFFKLIFALITGLCIGFILRYSINVLSTHVANKNEDDFRDESEPEEPCKKNDEQEIQEIDEYHI